MFRFKTLLVFVILVFAITMVSPSVARAQGTGPVVAFTARDGDIYFYHLDGSGLERITTDGHIRSDPASSEFEVEYVNLRWSPDGRYLAAVRQQSEPQPDRLAITTTVVVYDTHNRSMRQTGQDMNYFTWNPASTGLVYSLPVNNWSGRGQPDPPHNGIFQYDLTNGQVTEILPARDGRPLSFPSFSRTGRYLVSYQVIGMEGLGYFGIYDAQSGDYRVWGQDSNFAAANLNWSNDDSFVVFDQNTYSPSADSKIYRAGPSFEDVTTISPQVEGRMFFSPRLSPTEDRVLALSDPDPNTAVGPVYTSIWVFNLDGTEAREVITPQSPVYFFQWAPDGERLIYSSGDYLRETIQFMDVDTGQTELLGRGREFAIQPGAVVPAVQVTATPNPVLPTLEPLESVQALTATPATLAQPTPPDRIVPPAPAWVTPRLLVILLCGGGLVGLGILAAVVMLVRRR